MARSLLADIRLGPDAGEIRTIEKLDDGSIEIGTSLGNAVVVRLVGFPVEEVGIDRDAVGAVRIWWVREQT